MISLIVPEPPDSWADLDSRVTERPTREPLALFQGPSPATDVPGNRCAACSPRDVFLKGLGTSKLTR